MKVKLLEPIAGYEDVAEYRKLNKGDVYLDVDGGVITWEIGHQSATEFIVLTPKYPTPWTFHTGWVAMDKSRKWHWFSHKPKFTGRIWEVDGQGDLSELDDSCPNWEPPTGLTAENSLQEVNPQRDA